MPDTRYTGAHAGDRAAQRCATACARQALAVEALDGVNYCVLFVFAELGVHGQREDFGCGLLSLVFAPNSDQLATGLTVVITAAVQQWLGSLIELSGVQVDVQDSTLSIAISYRVRNAEQPSTASFQLQVAT